MFLSFKFWLYSSTVVLGLVCVVISCGELCVLKCCAFWVINQRYNRGLWFKASKIQNFSSLKLITSFLCCYVGLKYHYFQAKLDVEGAPLRRDWFNAQRLLWVHKDSGSQRNLFGVSRGRWEADLNNLRPWSIHDGAVSSRLTRYSTTDTSITR